MTYTILVATDLTPESLDLLRAAGDVEVVQVAPAPAAVRDKLKTAHAVIAREEVPFAAEGLAGAPLLRVIGRVGANLSGLDIDAATARGVIVMNTPGANAIAAAEHTFTLMLALSRKLVAAHISLKDGYWLLDRKRQAGVQLYGKTLGVIGIGRVGGAVAARALAFGMTVLAYDPYVSEEQLAESRVGLVGLRELLARADVVSLHVPYTPETRHLLDEKAIAGMKPGARVINAAHGGLIDESALAAAIKSGKLAGAAVDVFAEEPPYNSPLVGLENVIHTPHIGDNTLEATQDQSLLIAAQVLDALRGHDYRNAVNLPFVAGTGFEEARPYMALAEKMGGLVYTLARHPIRRVAIEYRGDEIGALLKPIGVAFLRGMLAPILGADKVNYINAPVLAAERGIGITQAKGLKTGDYTSIVACQVMLEDGETIAISGTLLDRREPHIIGINDYRMNFVPSGHLLIMGSYDQPGVIGKVGTLMATNGVNIASWQTGRAQPGGHTLTVLTLDEAIPDAVLETLRREDFVRHAHQVQV